VRILKIWCCQSINFFVEQLYLWSPSDSRMKFRYFWDSENLVSLFGLGLRCVYFLYWIWAPAASFLQFDSPFLLDLYSFRRFWSLLMIYSNYFYFLGWMASTSIPHSWRPPFCSMAELEQMVAGLLIYLPFSLESILRMVTGRAPHSSFVSLCFGLCF